MEFDWKRLGRTTATLVLAGCAINVGGASQPSAPHGSPLTKFPESHAAPDLAEVEPASRAAVAKMLPAGQQLTGFSLPGSWQIHRNEHSGAVTFRDALAWVQFRDGDLCNVTQVQVREEFVGASWTDLKVHVLDLRCWPSGETRAAGYGGNCEQVFSKAGMLPAGAVDYQRLTSEGLYDHQGLAARISCAPTP